MRCFSFAQISYSFLLDRFPFLCSLLLSNGMLQWREASLRPATVYYSADRLNYKANSSTYPHASQHHAKTYIRKILGEAILTILVYHRRSFAKDKKSD
jgi:hypothetical protein